MPDLAYNRPTPNELARITPWSQEAWEYAQKLIPNDAWAGFVQTVNSDRGGHAPAVWAHMFCDLWEATDHA